MFIEAVQNNGKKYLRLVQSIRVTNKSGYKVSRVCHFYRRKKP